ncbi:MAG: TraR/DksA C4-type zinc finger protein [Patescibacteria group bacterium]|jgi:RNA polymerase-binding transcription factor DksA|nr:TraR/DksA C4-type zinc finger protein [Patescibacteria group bacterium]MDD5172764.1 TraR/DksA C4-type zinc finger protein [Patescibacteria group bacterium]
MFKNSIKEVLQERRKKIKSSLEQVAKKSGRGENNYNAVFPQYGRAEDENAEEVAAFIDGISMGENLKKSLDEIDLALKKINSGKYGFCETCGKKISKERLKILPTARYCLNCKEDKK